MPFTSAISRIPQRWIVCALCSLALAIIRIKNLCFYAIEAIVNNTTVQKSKPSGGGCPFLFSGSVWERREFPLVLPGFYWNADVMDLADSAFSTGKFVFFLPAGVLTDLGHSRSILVGGMTLVAVPYLLIPFFPESEVTGYVVQNFFDGLGEAFIYISIFTLISRWALPWERNIYTVLVLAGIFYGDVLGHVFFRVIFLEYKSWGVGCFIIGTLGLVWLAFGLIFIYHSPGHSPFIQQREDPTGNSGHRRSSLSSDLASLRRIPWRKIFSSPPFLSLVLAYCSVDWASNLNIFDSYEMYEEYILRLPEKFGHESSIMMVTAVPASLLVALFADWANKHNLVSKTVVKKTFTFISVFFTALLQATSSMVGCNILLFWILSISAVYFLGLAIPVIYTTPIDLSVRHAGLLTGIMMGARTLCSVFTGKADTIFILDYYNLDQWRYNFIYCSTLTLALIIPFLIFGSGEAQHWKISRHGTSLPDEHLPVEISTSEGRSLPPPSQSSGRSPPRSQTKFWNKYFIIKP